jgi:SnoaL-like polyketide cyclase
VLRWREEIWNKQNLHVVDELAAPDYVCHMAGIPEPIRGPVALKRLFAAYLAAFETRVSTELLLAEDDLVAARGTAWLKHSGPFRGLPPTGKEVTHTLTDIYRIASGRIVEQWFEADLTGVMQRLGLPAPAAAGPAGH